MFKYIYKGYDCADVKITTTSSDPNTNLTLQYNEIDYFLNTRYISAPEAVHRLFEFNMHDKSHTVIRLAVHLPFENTISFVPGEELAALKTNPNTTLTAWFELNKTDIKARKLSYCQIPEHYVYTDKCWNTRNKVFCKIYYII